MREGSGAGSRQAVRPFPAVPDVGNCKYYSEERSGSPAFCILYPFGPAALLCRPIKPMAKVTDSVVSAAAPMSAPGEVKIADDEDESLSTALCKALDVDQNGCVTLNDIAKFLYFAEMGLPLEWEEMKTCLCELRKFGTGEIKHVNKTIDVFADLMRCDRKDVARKVVEAYKIGWKREILSLYDGGSVSCEPLCRAVLATLSSPDRHLPTFTFFASS